VDVEYHSRVATHWPNVLCHNRSAAPGPAASLPDLQMMDDSRWDNSGPGNTGFAFFRSNCRTLDLARAIVSSLHVLLASQSDQRFLMRLLHGSRFHADVTMALLPIDVFVNGPAIQGVVFGPWQRQDGMVHGNNIKFPPKDWVAGHASWTSNHTEKPALLRKLGAWRLALGADGSWV